MDDRLNELSITPPEITEDDTTQDVPVVEHNVKSKMTEEQFAEAKARATAILKQHPHIVGTCLTMKVARQLYNLATYTLREQLGELKVKPEDGIESILVDSMAEVGMQAFSRDQVLEGLQKYALPFTAAELHKEEEETAKEDRAERAKSEAARKNTRIPTGFRLDVDGEPMMARDRSVLLIGKPRPVDLLLNKLVSAAMAKPEQGTSNPRIVIIRLLASVQAESNVINAEANRDKAYVAIGSNQWVNAAANPTTFGKFMDRWLKRTYKNRCDLLVVDDLWSAFVQAADKPGDLSAIPYIHRVLRKWADHATCGLVGGLPLKSTLDPKDPKLGTIGVHAELREVTTHKTQEQTTTVDVCLSKPWSPEAAHVLFEADESLFKDTP